MAGDSREPSAAGPRATQVAVAALCVVGLLLAAVAAPTFGAAGGGDGSGAGPGGGPGDDPGSPDGEPGGGGPGLVDLLRWLLPADGPGEPDPDPDCAIDVEPRPTPGREVTVTVTRAGRPVEGALVRFEGDPVGRTDAAGEVRGRVPYVRQLTVRATLPGDVRCEAAARTALAAPAFALASAQDGGDAGDGRNVSRTVTVDGRVLVVVDGTPDPGTTVDVSASVDGVPMRNATVAVDGRTVGTTDDDGRYALGIPDDGTDRLRVRVERGEFAGETTVVVRRLDARLAPVGLVSLPGSPAVVRATLGAGPAADAVVTRDGRRLGTTDDEGRLRVRLPADPGATLTVRAEGRTATAPVWPLYAVTALVVGLPATALLVAVAVAVRRGATPGRAGRALARVARRATTLLVAAAVRVADAVERALDWLLAAGRTVLARARGLAGRVRSDWRGALRSLGARLVALPARAWRRVRRASWSWPWTGGAESDDAARAPRATGAGGPSEFDLRAAWRTTARRVVPSTWRTRTPREVVRAAAARDLPGEPLAELAAVFEEVEYGGRPLSAERRERARAAFAALRDHWRDREADGATAEGDR